MVGVSLTPCCRRWRQGCAPGPTAAGSEVGPEGGRVEAIDDGVAAGVQVPKDKEAMMHVLGCEAQHGWLEPVPQPQQVVRRPAHHEGQYDDHRHLQGLQPGLRDDASAAAPQV